MAQDTKLTNLWKLLQNHEVVIPNFQRDYAQGRDGKSDLRKRFLEQIKTNLESHNLESPNPLTLDFVYGTKNEKGQIEPLDGQQRLTTIWLLMWYAVYLNYDANKDKLATLSKFSYETRDSSKSFIEWLCDDGEKEFFKQETTETPTTESPSLSSRIQNCSGFHAVWRQDPTVQSILRMLSGTKDKNDGIEQVFNECKNLNNLFSDGNKNPIQFYYLDLDGIKQSNDLYIKMNARGEQLTGFENFKADLVSYFRKDNNLAKYVEPGNSDYILSQWDVDWTDLFWKNRNDVVNDKDEKQENEKQEEKVVIDKIDDLFFTFLKRFLLNAYLVKNGEEKQDSPVVSMLMKDEQGEYTSFELYSKLIAAQIGQIKHILDLLISKEVLISKEDNFVYTTIKDEIGKIPLLANKGYNLLPRYKKNKKKELEIDSISFQERVLMYGVCQYLAYTKNFDKTVFAHWLRVLGNLVYYNEIATYDSFVSRLRFVDEVVKLCLTEDKVFMDDPYKVLPTQYEKIKEKTTANYEQLKEEITKIKRINQKNNKIEETLKNLESLWIFEGRIECLLGENVLELNNLYEKLKEQIGDESNGGNLRSANKSLRDLFRAILTEVDINKMPDEMLFNNEHNRLRIYLNEVLKEHFIVVVKEIISGNSSTTDIIKNYKYGKGDWIYALVKDPNLWDYAEKGKYKKRGEEYYWCYKLNNHERDIPLISYSTFISEKKNVVPKGIEFISKEEGWKIEYKDEKKDFPSKNLS